MITQPNKKINDEVCMKLYNEGWSDRKIARYFKCGHNAVCIWRYKRGLLCKNISFRRCNDTHKLYIKLIDKKNKRNLFLIKTNILYKLRENKRQHLYNLPSKGKEKRREYRSRQEVKDRQNELRRLKRLNKKWLSLYLK